MKIICIGKNYAAHAKEMSSAVPSEPVFFMKPDTSLLQKGHDFYYPDFTKNLHHEIEVVYKVGKMGEHIAPEFALKYISEVGIGIDFTARDLQDKAKEKSLPWEIAKAFDNAAVICNEFIPIAEITTNNIHFHLDVNGKTVQVGKTSDMIFSIEQIIAYVSKFITLKTGDLIFTGTPEGVGAVQKGDVLSLFLEKKKMHEFAVK
jgi:2-keto-4-pentenoate hydratase/2-oxohepta-3-ene-1,7-dioic acid hydratase in catechol pathway